MISNIKYRNNLNIVRCILDKLNKLVGSDGEKKY